jgi:ubiquitin-conjugating enzyme E2 S
MSTGAICVNTLKKDWTCETTFAHVFSVIRCLLIVPFPESSLNDEAGKLFMESYDEYSKRARLMAGVHGKTHNSENDDDDKSEENASVKKKPLPRSSSSVESTKSLRDVNRSSNSSSSSSASIKLGAEKKSKKKGLKRL